MLQYCTRRSRSSVHGPRVQLKLISQVSPLALLEAAVFVRCETLPDHPSAFGRRSLPAVRFGVQRGLGGQRVVWQIRSYSGICRPYSCRGCFLLTSLNRGLDHPRVGLR